MPVAFDAYGTLFDVHAAVAAHAHRIGPKADQFSAVWRERQLQYSWVHGLASAFVPFDVLTERALDFASAAVAPISPDLRRDLLASYQELNAYAEVPEIIAQLNAAGVRRCILSNGTQGMIAAATKAAGLTGAFDALLTADQIQRYKTDPAIYAMVTDHFEVAAADVTLCSSNRWDIAGARQFGFRTIWVNRAGVPNEYPDLQPDHCVADLTAAVQIILNR
ncbi:MAG: haloacid dehalogenase type II [Pseudomonadota bacterium]